MKSIEEILAENIRVRRKSLKWSQKTLAKKAKISLHTVFRIEKCEQAPRRANIEEIAKALGCSREDLYLDPNKQEKPSATVGSLLQALSEQEKELAKIRANPLVVLAEKLSPELAKRAEKMLRDILKESAQASDKSDSEDHRKKQ